MQPLRRRTRRTNANMNVVPYIDVMLVLLIIFMAVTPMIQTQVLNLPSVGASAAVQEPPLVVEMNEKGEFTTSVAGSSQSYANAGDLVMAVLNATQAKSQPVVLAADQSIAYGEVMAVMDALKQAKIPRIGLLLKQNGEVKP